MSAISLSSTSLFHTQLPPPRQGSFVGSKAVYIARPEDVRLAFLSQDLVRGIVDTPRLPYIIVFALSTLFENHGHWMFGMLPYSAPEREARSKFTQTKLDDLSNLKEIVVELVKLLKSQDFVQVRVALLEFIIRRFLPDYKVTLEDLEDIDMVHAMLSPSLLWLSPYHTYRLRKSKSRLLSRVGNNIEYYHHLNVGSYVWEIMKNITTPKFAKEVEDASVSDLGYNVVRAFVTDPTAIFRVAKVDTDIDGILPSKVNKGTIIISDLEHATSRDHRFTRCPAQRLVTQLVAEVVRGYYPDSKVYIGPSMPEPLWVSDAEKQDDF